MKQNTVIEGKDILTLIPQRSPIVMIDRFFGIENSISYSELAITEDNIFFERGHFNESGIIEHIAQSAAARVGYVCQQMNVPVPLGFIGSVDKMKIHTLPTIGDKLETSVSIIQEVMDITLIHAEVKIKEELIAECNMKIVLNKK